MKQKTHAALYNSDQYKCSPEPGISTREMSSDDTKAAYITLKTSHILSLPPTVSHCFLVARFQSTVYDNDVSHDARTTSCLENRRYIVYGQCLLAGCLKQDNRMLRTRAKSKSYFGQLHNVTSLH